MNMDDDACFRALTARDARFDGVFFVVPPWRAYGAMYLWETLHNEPDNDDL